jgi:putative endonuclease
MTKRQYAVYILTNAAHTVLYVGVTNDLQRRVIEHRTGKGSIFTRRYNVKRLVYYELGDEIGRAILREKQLKAGSRQDKLDLIQGFNPEWKDLYEELFEKAG